jgi:protein TonB
LISIRQPEYPELAREAGIEGKVIVRVLVGADGFVHTGEVLESVLGLDDAALVAARTAVFRPAQQQGRPVPAWIVIPIEFVLHHR